jgi:dihydroorotase (multifunctional complex type)
VLDLRILNGTLVADGLDGPFDIGIDGGQIAEIEAAGAVSPARVEIDAGGLHLMPGAVDVHFHCRAPSRPDRGDFGSESAAAAAGGVTTILEMPISDPACSTPDTFRSRRALATSQAHVNVGLYSGAALRGRERAAEMAEIGAIGFKLFTIAPAPKRESEFAGLWATDEGQILESLRAITPTGLPCVLHAENDRLVRHFARELSPDGVPRRPPVIESAAIAAVAALAKEAGTRTHIAHVTSRAALDALRGAVALGADVTGETCPQYLSLDSSAVGRVGGLAKVAPPLREPDDVAALWGGLHDGTLDLVASDHSPFLAHEKQVAYAEAPQGLPTVELLVPVVLDGAVRGRLPLHAAVAYLTAAPAKRFGLYPRKGSLAVGSDADITAVALDEEFRPSPNTFVSRAAGCAIVFAGMRLRARVEQTFVNGALVYDRGRIVGDRAGRFVPGQAALLEPV